MEGKDYSYGKMGSDREGEGVTIIWGLGVVFRVLFKSFYVGNAVAGEVASTQGESKWLLQTMSWYGHQQIGFRGKAGGRKAPAEENLGHGSFIAKKEWEAGRAGTIQQTGARSSPS